MTTAVALAALAAALLALGLSPDRVLELAGDAGMAREEGLRHGALLARATAAARAVALGGTAFALARARTPVSPPPRAPAGPDAWAAVAALVLLALALRLVRLDQGLWYDEIVTWVEYVRLPFGALVTTYTAQNNHLLYSLSARLAFLGLGEGAFALRLPAALFGAAGVAALFVFARRVVATREALLASLLLAVSYHHVWFSQNARGYTGLLVATTLGTALFLDGMRRPARARWLAYAACLALALYVHLSAVFAFAVHGLAWLALLAVDRRGGRPPRWPGARSPWPLAGFGLGGLLALQLYAVLIPQIVEAFVRQAGTEAVVKVETWTSPLWTALEVVRGLARLGPLTLGVAGVAGAVGAFGTWRLARRDPLAVGVMLVPAPLTLAALLAIHFHVWPRYFFALLGFFLVLGVHGVFEAARAVARRAGRPHRLAERVATAALLLAALGSAFTVRTAWLHPKQDFVGARDFVEAQRAPDDVVVTAGLATYPYDRLYAPAWGSVEDAAELEAVAAAPGRTWLVMTFPAYMAEAHPKLLERARTRFARVRPCGGTVGGGEIQVWRSREAPRAPEGAS
ncbi:MAG: glycosyltransferase family 39 protein [Myxococcota bacterium]|nr:glycosyltransferase family 39 protein [Myxococcota bacterium]